MAQNLDEVNFSRSICAAASTGNISKVKGILERMPEAIHSDGRLEGKTGYTALHFAAREGHLNIVKLLIDHGADVNKQTTVGGATALHRAAFTGKLSVVRTLIQAGANPCIKDADGQTALHKAMSQRQTSVAETLLQCCPELEIIRDAKGRLPQDLSSS